MNKNQFISFIQDPEQLTADKNVALDRLIKEFPYFQTAHLLHVKQLHNQNSIHYNHQLKVAAAYITDRKILYQLITKKEQETTLIKTEVSDVPKNESVIIEKLASKTPKETEEKLQNTSTTEDNPVFEEIQRTENDIAVLNQEFLKEVINSNYEIGVDQTPLQPLKTEVAPTITSEAKDTLNKEAKHSFNDWLKLTNPKTEESVKGKIVLSELIDKFIVEEPKLSKPVKTEFFSPVDKARQSVAEDLSFVTETLAKIYEKQGNYIKAIKAYENLSLRIPEKKLFFAARIKEIKKFIHQQK